VQSLRISVGDKARPVSRNFRGILYRKQLRPRAAGKCSTDYERELNGSPIFSLVSNVEQQHAALLAIFEVHFYFNRHGKSRKGPAGAGLVPSFLLAVRRHWSSSSPASCPCELLDVRQAEALLEPLDLGFGFLQMRLEQLLQLLGVAAFTILGSAFCAAASPCGHRSKFGFRVV
jgi:hypothetical protein